MRNQKLTNMSGVIEVSRVSEFDFSKESFYKYMTLVCIFLRTSLRMNYWYFINDARMV